MKFDANDLLSDLLKRTQSVTERAFALSRLAPESLRTKPAPGKWSASECIEHLNLYGDFYLPEIERAIIQFPRRNAEFKSGFIGNYFVKLVSAENGVKPMKTDKTMNPVFCGTKDFPFQRFIKQQELLAELLDRCRETDLTRAKTRVSIMPGLRIRLGDTLRFLVQHNERHLLQAENAVREAVPMNVMSEA